MKKLINKIGIIFFSLSPIVAIASTPSNSPTSDSSQFRANQSFKTKLKKSFKNSKWTSQTQINSGSNIIDGRGGAIFEDSRGILWSMGNGTPLQKYNYERKKWAVETKDRKNSSGSNIIDGKNGAIFEDSRGNLWSMGRGTPLQKYNYQTKKWTTETKESSGSNINDGENGTIFEDSRGNLWSMGKWTPLQKYNYQIEKWTTETRSGKGNSEKLLLILDKTPNQKLNSRGSNITNGESGTIFEDSRGNLWSMGAGTPLQKYNYQTKKWTTENSDIFSGRGGTIFEDSRGNLWSMSIETSPQKYNYSTKRWTAQTSESNGFKTIYNGLYGTIFEDSRGNLWSMGWWTTLQKYDYQTKKWIGEIKDRKMSSGSNITNGLRGTIFEDSRGNLWSMGWGTPLQKYNYQTKKWTEETSDKKNSTGSNILSGQGGTIFEDSRGNLWSMGKWTPLQKLIPTKETNLDDQKVKHFDIEFKIRINKDSKIAILIKGYRKYTSNLFTHLRYKKKTESTWKIVKKRTMVLDAAEYEFKWVLGTEETLTSGQNLPQKITIDAKPNNIEKVKTFLASLSSSDFSSLASSTKLVQIITKTEILAKIKATSSYSTLTSAQQWLIIRYLITKANDPDGTLKVIIDFESKSYQFNTSGFLKVADDNITKVKAFLNTLSNQAISSLVKNSKSVGAFFTKFEFLKLIQATSGYSALNWAQKKLITHDSISFSEDPARSPKVTITFKDGTSKILSGIPKRSKKAPSGLSIGTIIGIALASIFGIAIIGFLIFSLVKRDKK